MSGGMQNARDRRKILELLVRKLKEVGLLGRVRCTCKDNIKTGVEIKRTDSLGLIQNLTTVSHMRSN